MGGSGRQCLLGFLLQGCGPRVWKEALGFSTGAILSVHGNHLPSSFPTLVAFQLCKGAAARRPYGVYGSAMPLASSEAQGHGSDVPGTRPLCHAAWSHVEQKQQADQARIGDAAVTQLAPEHLALSPMASLRRVGPPGLCGRPTYQLPLASCRCTKALCMSVLPTTPTEVIYGALQNNSWKICTLSLRFMY